EIGDIHRQMPIRVKWVPRLEARVIALLFRRLDRLGRGAAMVAFGNESGELWVVPSDFGCQGVIGSNRQKLGAKQRVGPCRIDFDLAGRALRRGLQLEAERKPLRAADPI